MDGRYCSTRYNRTTDRQEARTLSTEDHKLLFCLYYKRDLQLNAEGVPAIMLRIVEIMALAEYYDSLRAVAGLLQQLIVDLPNIWKDVADVPRLYLAVGKKLRCAELFADALRHLVGRGMSVEDVLRSDILTKSEACIAILPAKQCLEKRTSFPAPQPASDHADSVPSSRLSRQEE